GVRGVFDQGCGADSGKSLDTIQQLRIKIHESGVVIAGAGGSEAECEEIALVESEIMTLKIGERAHEKAGTNHEHHRRSDLRDDERFAEAMLVAWIRNGGRVVLHGGQEDNASAVSDPRNKHRLGESL